MTGRLISQKMIYRGDLRSNPNVLYVFGDNEQRKGLGGQAKEMRGEPNAVGIRTKRRPDMEDGAFWTDKTYLDNCRMIDEDMARLYQAVARGDTVIIPGDGIGTGFARLEHGAPRTYAYLRQKLETLDDWQ